MKTIYELGIYEQLYRCDHRTKESTQTEFARQHLSSWHYCVPNTCFVTCHWVAIIHHAPIGPGLIYIGHSPGHVHFGPCAYMTTWPTSHMSLLTSHKEWGEPCCNSITTVLCTFHTWNKCYCLLFTICYYSDSPACWNNKNKSLSEWASLEGWISLLF